MDADIQEHCCGPLSKPMHLCQQRQVCRAVSKLKLILSSGATRCLLFLVHAGLKQFQGVKGQFQTQCIDAERVQSVL